MDSSTLGDENQKDLGYSSATNNCNGENVKRMSINTTARKISDKRVSFFLNSKIKEFLRKTEK